MRILVKELEDKGVLSGRRKLESGTAGSKSQKLESEEDEKRTLD